MNKKKITRNELYFIIFFFLILFIALFNHFKTKEEKSDILDNYKSTKGYFIDYDKVGDTGTPYITYSYKVDNKVYKRQVYGTRKLEYCYKKDCSEKMFWVIYSPQNPKKSLINLQMEIQGMKDPPFPETLKNFK